MASLVWNGTEPECGKCGSKSFCVHLFPDDHIVCNECHTLLAVNIDGTDTVKLFRWSQMAHVRLSGANKTVKSP